MLGIKQKWEMDRRITRIKDEDIGKWRITPNSNNVIIEITERSEDKTTKGGIYVGYNKDVVYGEGDGSHEADVAEVWGIVMATPPSLYYNPKNSNQGMPWETSIEIKEGDMVWFDYFASVNCDVLKSKDRMFYVINYSDIYVGKRGDRVIPLNGYCLCVPVEKEVESELARGIGDEHEKGKVKVVCLGRPNDHYPSYQHEPTYYSDRINIREGDVVLLRRNYKPYLLERMGEISTFGQEVYVVQRRFMEMVV